MTEETPREYTADDEARIEAMAQMFREAGYREVQLPDGTWTFEGLGLAADAARHQAQAAPAATPGVPDSQTSEAQPSTGASAVCGPHTAHTPATAPEQGRPGVQRPHTAPETRQLDAAAPAPTEDGTGALARLADRLSLTRLPEVVTAAQPPLIDRVRYSVEGEWTARETGAARTAHKLYTYLFAIPVTTAAYVTAWAVERPMRFAYFVACLLIIGTAFAQLPILEFVIPDAVNVTAWF